MPTDLPPGYKPKKPDANAPEAQPGAGAPPGEDARDPAGGPPSTPNAGLPGPDGDVVDPSGLGNGSGVPSPAGTPSF